MKTDALTQCSKSLYFALLGTQRVQSNPASVLVIPPQKYFVFPLLQHCPAHVNVLWCMAMTSGPRLFDLAWLAGQSLMESQRGGRGGQLEETGTRFVSQQSLAGWLPLLSYLWKFVEIYGFIWQQCEAPAWYFIQKLCANASPLFSQTDKNKRYKQEVRSVSHSCSSLCCSHPHPHVPVSFFVPDPRPSHL